MNLHYFLWENSFRFTYASVYGQPGGTNYVRKPRFHCTHQQQNGIPQGSVLSCSIFKLAIDSIVKKLPRNVRKSLFMDDYCVYISARRIQQCERILNLVLKKLKDWARETGFKFSVEKTKAVIFYKNKKWIKNHQIQLKLGENILPVVEEQKFLGVIFDTHLNFRSHAKYIKGKCKKALNLLNKVSHTKWGADRKTLKILYKATVQSILDYGSQIYGSATEPVLSTIEPIHNEGIRRVTGAFRSSPVDSLLAESGEPPLDLHREYVIMKSKLNLQHNTSPILRLVDKNDMYWKEDGRADTAPFPTRVRRLYQEMDIETRTPTNIEPLPLWTIQRAKFCYYLINTGGKDNIPQVLKQKALRHINSKGRHFSIFTDGSKSEDKVGCAAISTQESRATALPSHASIFTAELWAIKQALDTICNTEFTRYIIYCDSKSALDAIRGFQPTNHIITDIINRIHTIKTNSNKTIEFCWVLAHVGLAGNEYADKAAKEAAQDEPIDMVTPPKDHVPAIKKAIKEKWQRKWNNVSQDNKLRQIKTKVEEWKTSKQEERRTEVVMTRLRIGHTNATHSYLMTMPHKPHPTCEQCGAHLSVKHFMKDCPRKAGIIARYFGSKSLKEILGEETPVNKVISYLKEIKLYDCI